MSFDKKYLLLIVAAVCVGLYFYGSYTKNSEYPKYLPVIGGLAFGLNTLIQLAH
jgi:hypothetical protein